MKNLNLPVDLYGNAYLIISCHKATDLNEVFCALSHFSREEILGRDIEEILSILRVPRTAREQLKTGDVAVCWLFTKDMEPREVTISCFQKQRGVALYTFEEKPNSRLEEVLSYPCQLLEENMIGVSIYAAADFTLLKANQMYLDFNDKPFNRPENTIGKSIYEFAKAYRGSHIETVISNIFITEKSEILKELEYTGHARGVTYWDQIITPVKADGKIKYIITNTQEVTERVLARKQFNEQNKLLDQKKTELAAIIENMSEALLIFDTDGNYTMINKAAREMFLPLAPSLNRVGDVLLTTQFFDIHGNLIPPEENPSLRVKRGEVLDSIRIGLKQGSLIIYTDVNGMPLYDEAGRFAAGIISCRDVTAQVKSEEQYRYLFEAMQSGVVQYDARGTAITMNPAAEHILGIAPEELLGSSAKIKHPTVKVDGAMLPREEYPVVKALNSGKPIQDVVMEFYNAKRNEYRWISVNAVPLVLPGDSKPYQVFAVFDDITEQKKTEDALRESEARLRSVLENSNDMIYSLNLRTNHYEYLSPACEKVLGFTLEEYMSMDKETVYAMIHPDDLPSFKSSMAELYEKDQKELMYRQRIKSGSYRWFSNRLSLVRDDAGCVLNQIGNMHDITEQVKNDAFIRYQANLMQNISDMIVCTDKNLVINSWNKAAELKYGWTEEEAIGQNVRTLLKVEAVGMTFEERANRIMIEGRVESEVIHTCKDGRKLNALSTVEALRNNKGIIVGTIGIFHDITERRKMEDALRVSEQRLRFVLENSSDIIYSLNVRTNKYVYVSPAYEKVMGYTLDDIMENDRSMILARVHPEDLPAFLASLAEADVKNQAELHYRQRVNSGEYRWFSNRMSVIRDEDGQVLFRNGIIHDITEQVENDKVIRYQANLLQNISDMIISTDDKLIIKSWNKAAELKYGWTEAEAIGKNVRTLLQAEVIGATFEEKFSRLLEQGKVEFEVIHTCKDGRKLNALNTLVLLKNSDGNFIGTVGIFRDITERKKIEDALRERDLYLQMAAKGAELGTYAYDFANGRMFLSDELKALWGLKSNESVQPDADGRFFQGMHPDDKQEFLDKIYAANDPEGDGLIELDYRIILKNGAVKWLHMRGQTTFTGEVQNRRPIFAAGVVIDITKRVQAENSNKEISEELSNIIESTDDYIWSVDRNYRLVFYNSAFERYIMSRFGRQLEKGDLMEDIITPEDGTLWEDFYVQTASEGKYQIEVKTDNGARVISYSFNPVYIDSELVEITVFGKDITERINSEREIIRLNTSLEKRVSERTEELQKSINNLQTLSRIISHDLKEPIREIETLAKQIGSNADIQANSMRIRQTCNNMTSMIEGLSQYAMSAEHKIQKEPVNVKKMIISIYNDLKSALTKRSVLQFESGFPLVYADAVLFRQVLYNLISNALKFSCKRDIAEIAIGCVEENDHYVFSIKDNGAGFDMHYVHKLFSIFERLHTKDEFEGSGIGLAAVRNIIQRHGGRVWINSEENVGTVVFFTLPVTDNI